MNKLLIWGGLLVLVGAGFWYVSTHPREEQMSDEEVWVLSASFACTDGTHFIASFPTATTVDIIVDGNTVRTVPLVEGIGKRYEDADYAYVFAGEEVTVTAKATGATATCSQPVDPNNAPVNFGDAGEGGGTAVNLEAIVNSDILGSWKSTTDGNFVRDFAADGIVSDRYSGAVTGTGSWKTFTKENPLSVPFPLEDQAVYLLLTVGDETLHFKVSKLTPETLELIYMDRGGALTFTRLQ